MARKKSASKKAREAEIKNSSLNNEDIRSREIKPLPLPLDLEKLKQELQEEEKINESSNSEEEDEFGELLTKDVESGLSEVLTAIKTGDKRLFDSNVRFFDGTKKEEANEEEGEQGKKDKPIYLKDYHRMNLLDTGKDKEEEKPFAIYQKEEKDRLVDEIHNAFGGDENEEEGESDDDDDEFLKKKEKKEASKVIEKIELPDPKQDSAKFLEAYLDNQAWLPDKGDEIQLEEDDEEFDNAAERFENAYNFRFEDPNAAEIISYARSQATMRREKSNSRKKERLKKQENKKKETEEKEELLKKKKQKKVNLVMDRIKEIRQAVGEDVSEDVILRVFGDSLMNRDFDDADWDSKMSEIFNDEYYGNEDVKPEWKDDIGDDEEEKEEEEKDVNDDSDEEVEEFDEKTTLTKSKKREEKYNKKKDINKIKQVAEKIVESKTVDLIDEVEEERGRSKKKDQITFRYREVSPESYGLSTREILMANDSQLNDYIGLKKFAPYRAKELRDKDKRKVAKRKRLREWRMKVFNDETGPATEEGDIVKIPSIVNDEGPKKKYRKRNDYKSR